MGKDSSCGRTSPWIVILAGGAGLRLLPVTRALTGSALPKQFCSFVRGRTLLQETLSRVRPLMDPTRTLVVVNTPYTQVARDQVDTFGGITLVEQPRNRGTAPGILLPLVRVQRENPGATVVLLPSDHGLANVPLLVRGLQQAVAAVEESPTRIVVGGVQAGHPSTDFGWIVPEGGPLDPGSGPCMRRVRYFAEKPSHHEAMALFRQGSLWSTFILVARAPSLLDLFRSRMPDCVQIFEKYAGMAEPQAGFWLRQRYERLPVSDFSSDLLANLDRLVVLAWPEALGWADLGTPQRLIQWLSGQRDIDRAIQDWVRSQEELHPVGLAQ